MLGELFHLVNDASLIRLDNLLVLFPADTEGSEAIGIKDPTMLLSIRAFLK